MDILSIILASTIVVAIVDAADVTGLPTNVKWDYQLTEAYTLATGVNVSLRFVRPFSRRLTSTRLSSVIMTRIYSPVCTTVRVVPADNIWERCSQQLIVCFINAFQTQKNEKDFWTSTYHSVLFPHSL
jgi:hypothetical protein